MVGHRWSGWPGAWCLDCGIEDYLEIATADVYDPYENAWEDSKRAKELQKLIEEKKECKEPGSKRFDPYFLTEVCLRVCKSGKFETGEGTCAPICMDQLGDPRKGKCRHARDVHRDFVRYILYNEN